MRAAKHFRHLAENARKRSDEFLRKARATDDLVAKTNLEAKSDGERAMAIDLDRRAAELE